MRLFTATELKVIGLSVAAATVVAIVITVSVGLVRQPRSSTKKMTQYGGAAEMLDTADILVPEEFTLTGGERWYFSRESMRKWNDDQVRRYWIDPMEIGIDLLREDTDRAIEELVKQIP